MSTTQTDLQRAAEELLEPLGYEVLELNVSGRGNKRHVLLRIDRLDGAIVGMEDVETATGVFSLELDRLDPFDSEYTFGVESPGPERPLKTAAHFRRFSGLLAKVKTASESFTGRVEDVSDNAVRFSVGQSVKTVALNEIDSARLAEWPDTPR